MQTAKPWLACNMLGETAALGVYTKGDLGGFQLF